LKSKELHNSEIAVYNDGEVITSMRHAVAFSGAYMDVAEIYQRTQYVIFEI